MSKRKDRPGKRSATIDFDIQTFERLQAIAKSEQRSLGSQVRFIIQRFLESLPKQRK